LPDFIATTNFANPMQANANTSLSAEQRARFVFDNVPADGLFAGGTARVSWRVSPEAFALPRGLVASFESLGAHLLKFYRAANLLYRQSWQGKAPSFVAEYLDAGKPDALVQASRMNRFKQELPRVIRPDILLLEQGLGAQASLPVEQKISITELDSVPGGMGLTGSLGEIYARLGDDIVGGADGMVKSFAAMLRGLSANPQPRVAIVVSEESASYRPEMDWLGGRLAAEGIGVISRKAQAGRPCRHVLPEDLRVTEEGVFVGDERVDIVYRFFELFDLDNVARAQELIRAASHQRVAVTPPFKPYLEEKLLFALFQHPALRDWWRRELGEETFAALQAVFPRTWIFDARPLPPHAVIPDLQLGGRAVTSWEELKTATQRERELILKISGFHANAWGARGVALGRDMPANEWAAAIDAALAAFPKSPHILQRFAKSRLVETAWFDFEKNELRPMQGRARLCPYYFVTRLPSGDDAGEVKMGGVLATICPPDKKLLHGMSDAVMCACRMGD
jgi:hypothetical protein